jgi:HAD superfamily hydrolase (TIGR01484 family)
MARGLFVTDLDGTLIEWQGGMAERNVRLLRRAIEQDVVVAVVTGRRRSTVFRDLTELEGLPFRTSCSNGAVLLGPDHVTVERVHELAWTGVLDLARRADASARALIGITLPDDLAEPDALIRTPDGTWAEAVAPWDPATHVVLEERVAIARRLVHAALHCATREDAERLEALARECCGPEVDVHAVKSPRGGGALAEVVVPGGKGRTVRDLVSSLGIPEGATGAIGDDMNDGSLLDAARHRYAVGGSILASRRPDVTEVAPAERAAVADALERFLAELSG